MKEQIAKKNKSLKQAIEKYNMYKEFVEEYSESKTLTKYISYINDTKHSYNESMRHHYETLVNTYNNGDTEPLLSHLYDRLIDVDEYKNKLTCELKSLLRNV